MKKYGAAFRGLLDATAFLILARLLDDSAFATLMAAIYPIYFICNLLFSSSTVDLAGGMVKFSVTSALIIPSIFFVILFVSIKHGSDIFSLYLVIAGLSATESIAFVICETKTKANMIYLLLIPRVLFVSSLLLSYGFSKQYQLDDAVGMLFGRDVLLLVFGICVLVIMRGGLSFGLSMTTNRISEVAYLIIANAHDFLLRITFDWLFGSTYMKAFEYALRLPKIAQIGVMYYLRHWIFSSESKDNKSRKMLWIHFISSIFAIVIIALYNANWNITPFIIVGSAIVASSAVPWYINSLRERNFILLVFVQIFSFFIAILAAILFTDPYISTFYMVLVLFIFSLIDRIKAKNSFATV